MALGQGAQERTLEELFEALELDESIPLLSRIVNVDATLNQCGIEIRPKLQDGRGDQRFLLRKAGHIAINPAEVLKQISNIESASQEFKSTYWCDHNRRLSQTNATRSQLRSDSVKHSALKSIAGFITTGGGKLFLGVADNGEIIGLQPDLEILSEGHQSVDRLINNIRTDITDKFREGVTVNDYVLIQPVTVEEVEILQVDVASRRRLTFLKASGSELQLYKRQGNRTSRVEIYELEEFSTWREDHLFAKDS